MSTPAEYIEGGDDAGRSYDEIVAGETRAKSTAIAAPTTAIAVTNEPQNDLSATYDDLVAEDVAEAKRRQGLVQGVASKYNPEQYAEATKLASEFGIDAKTVADNPEPYRKESKRRAAEGTLKDAPATREWLATLDNAAVAQDDLDNLSNLERTLTRGADVVRALPAGAVQAVGMGASGVGRLYGAAERKWADLVDSGLRAIGAESVADFLRQPTVLDNLVPYVNPGQILGAMGGDIEAAAKFIAPPVERQNIVTEVAGALGQIGGQVATALAAGPATALALLFGQGADIQGDRAEAAGASQEDTDLAVAWGAAITGITEKYQLDELLKFVPSSVRLTIVERLKRAAVAGFGEAAQEITEGIGQNIAAKSIYDPEAKIFDLDQIKSDGTVAGTAGAVAKFIIDAIVPGKARSNPGADRVADAELLRIAGMRGQVEGVERGQAAGELSAELVRLVGAAKLTERSPEQLESFGAAVKEQTGIQYAYVDPAAFRTLFQSDDQANAAASELSGAQNTYYESAISGAPIAVPIEKYIARLAPKLAEAKVEGKRFSDFVAFDPEGMNGNEAGTEFEKLFEEAKKAAEREATDGTVDSSQAIYDDTLAQLVATGMEPRTAKINANLTRWTFNALATRGGIDPLELYRRYDPKIRARFEGQAAAGATELTQGAIETPQFKQWFGESKVVDESGAPRVVYHGTRSDFASFDAAKTGHATAPSSALGFFFTEDAGNGEAQGWMASGAATWAADRDGSYAGGGNIMPVYLALQNPKAVTPAQMIAAHSDKNAAIAIREQAISEGHDGLTFDDAGERWHIAFNPAQIKSATGNTGAFDPTSDNVLFQDDPTLPFYSALTRAAENAEIKNNKASPVEWLAKLRKGAGVKAEEIATTGVEEWLNEQGKSVTKEAVVDYLRANQLVIEEKDTNDGREEDAEPEVMSPEDRRDFARRIDRHSNYLQDYLDDSDGYYMVNADPSVNEDSFTVETTIEQRNEDDSSTLDLFTGEVTPRVSISVIDLELEVEVEDTARTSHEGGVVRAIVKFPDGRYVKGVADFDFDEDDGSISDLEPNRSHHRWREQGTFTESELAAVDEALKMISLSPNRELSEDAQEDARRYEHEMSSASDSLRDGQIGEALDYLQNATDIESEYDSEGRARELRQELEDADAGVSDRDSDSDRGGTRHDTYQTPGGEGYTEFKLYLPTDKGAMARDPKRKQELREQMDALQRELEGISDEGIAIRQQYPVISERPPEVQQRVEALRTREVDIYAEKEKLRQKFQQPKRDYVSPSVHWDKDDLNIVAFVRFNTRTDKDGKRVLFLEEIQSDWHQYGRKYGYEGDGFEVPEPVTELPEGWSWITKPYLSTSQMDLLHNGEWVKTRTLPERAWDESPAEYDQKLAARAVEMYNDKQQGDARERISKQVPDAPLKTTWREMAFKRMLRYAADNGYDRIGWTPGKIQSERYNRAFNVDELQIKREADGKLSFTARQGDKNVKEIVNSEDQLASYIGKEFAAQAAKLAPGQEDVIRGKDLRVDNTGLVHLYDSILLKEVAKLSKQFGGGKVAATYLTPTEEGLDPSEEFTTSVARGETPVHSIDITPALREAALAGLPMFQRGAPTIEGDTTGKRGSITWGTDRKFTINLFEKRDLSTYLHESGHLYLEILGDLAEDANAPQQIKDDYATLLKWLKVKDRAGIGTEQHEQLARGFEAYLAEGKAPSVELQPVFFRFRQWMMAVYKAIRNLGSTPGSIGAALNVSLTDEVRAVMDRMVATDEQIAEAEQAQQYAPIFTTAEDAGMSAAEWSAYRDIVDKAHREGVDELTTRAMADLAREKRRWWRDERGSMLTEVTAEVNASPVYRAIALLTKGKNPDGSALEPGVPAFQLSRADIDTRFGADARKRLPRGSTTAGPEGISAETAAQLLGFASGADLVRSLVAAPARKKAIDQITDARMRERHGDMMLDGSMVEQAIDSVHTEGRAKVLAAELKALNRKRAEAKPFVDAAGKARKQEAAQAREANAASLPTRDEMRAIREAAQQAIAAKKIRTITPHLYRAAERKAAKRAFEMAAKGKFEDAYLAKRQQILNYELYRASAAARTQVEKQVVYMRGLSKKSAQERLAKAKGQYREQINALLARFDFTPQPADADLKRDALAKWVDEQIAAGREVTIPQWVIDEARTTPYKELTAAELTGLVDAAKNIEHLAKTKDRLLRNRAKAQFEQAKVELEARARESLKGGKAPPVSKFEEGLFKEFGRGTVGFFNSLLRPETIIEWLDGGQAGPWHDFVMEPANNAEYARESLRTKILEPMRKLANEIDSKRRDELNEDIHIGSLGQSLNRRTLISIALNMGNASNMDRLLKGGFRDPTNRNRIRKFTPQSLIEIQGKLTLKDWQFIQEMWNTAESLWPAMKAFQERMGGLVPEKIPATPIVTRFGTFTGGYWPAVYDSLASKAGAKQADSADALGILMGGNFTGASTNKSALKERSGAGGPLKLDFSAVMGRHLDQVITDITHREFAIQAMRILDDPDLSLTLQDAIGEVGWHSLRGMVGASIQQDSGFADLATKDIDTIRRRFISNLAVAALGLKLTTAIGNMALAPIQAAARVNPKYLLTGIAKYMRHPIEGRAFVDASSEMMRNRAQNMDASFSVIREKLEGRNSILAQTQRAAMAIHQAADHLGTTGIWIGRYQQARDAGEAHDEAVRLADKAIRTTQTAGAPKDLSAFERNPAYRELKLFIGPMIIMQNRMREAVRGRGVVKSWPEAFGVLIATWFLPAILWDIVNGRGPDDDDDDDEVLTDEFLPWALRKLVAYPFATLPYLRDAASLAERKWFGGYSEARMNPVSDAAWLLLKTGKESADQMGEADADDEDDARKYFKLGLNASGPLIGLPSNQIDITTSYLWDVWSGEYEPEGAADWRYLVMRRPKEE